MKNKLKIFGIGITVLFILLAIMPVFDACGCIDLKQDNNRSIKTTPLLGKFLLITSIKKGITQLNCDAWPSTCQSECNAYNEAWDNWVRWPTSHNWQLVLVASESLDTCMAGQQN